jgi:hypothetical protein
MPAKDSTHGLPSSWQQDDRISVSSSSSPLPHSYIPRHASLILLASQQKQSFIPGLLRFAVARRYPVFALEISRSSESRGEHGVPLLVSPLFRSSMEFRVDLCYMCSRPVQAADRVLLLGFAFLPYIVWFFVFLSTKRCSWEEIVTWIADCSVSCLSGFII